jgi:hypothetical protein
LLNNEAVFGLKVVGGVGNGEFIVSFLYFWGMQFRVIRFVILILTLIQLTSPVERERIAFFQ